MFERGLAYRKRSTVNWCPSCKTVLANEQVVDGACWRCGIDGRHARSGAVVLPHHRLRRRAARGARDADRLAGEGRRHAAELDRALRRRPRQVPAGAVPAPMPTSRSSRPASTRSTARPSCCSRPSIRWSIGSRRESPNPAAFRERVAKFRALDREARLTGAIEKEGFDTGRKARQPVHRRGRADLDRQLRPGRVRHRRDHGACRRTTSATSSSPGSTACRSRVVVQSGDEAADGRDDDRGRRPTTGALVNSGEYAGQEAPAVMTRMIADAEKRGIGTGEVQYRLKDWGISRQRYWGTPIPIIHCEKDGVVAGAVRGPAGRAAEGRRPSPAAAIRRWRRCRSS